MKRRNDRGSTIVLVIVVLAIIGILASVSLWMSLRNFQMKVTDSKIKNSFYSAESVLDQVCVGLQEKVSYAYGEAYIKTMQSYNPNISKVERENDFKQTFVTTLRDTLSDGAENRYDPDIIESMIAPSALAAGSNVAVKCENPLMVVQNGAGKYSVTLCDIEVDYVDENEMLSMIKTDIVIEAPNFGSISAAALPDIFSFSLIVNSGIIVNNNTLTISGNVYAGAPYWHDATKSRTAIQVSADSTAKIDLSGAYVVADGDVKVNGTSDSGQIKFKTNEGSQLWASNIEVRSARVELDGLTYVSDDLTLMGNSPSVKLGSGQGKYYGYGNSTQDSSNSSAIILNGKNCYLDMTQLDELVVAGYSYIGTNRFADQMNSVNAAANVTMGESVAIKSDQYAYLLPGECIGTAGDTLTSAVILGRNPITYDEYISFSPGKPNYGKTLVNEAVIAHETGIENALTYTKLVFDNVNRLVYFYLDLPVDKAEAYYKDYVENNPDGSGKLSLYMKYYTNGIKYSDSHNSLIYTAGSAVSYDGTNVGWKESNTGDEITARLSQLSNTYDSLTTCLSSNPSDILPGMNQHELFTNYIDTDVIHSIMTNGGKSHNGAEVDALLDGVTFTYKTSENDVYALYIYGKNQVLNTGKVIGDVQKASGLYADAKIKDIIILCTHPDSTVRIDQSLLNCMIFTNGSIELMGASQGIMPMNSLNVRKVLSATYTDTVDGNKVYTAYQLFKNSSEAWIGSLGAGGNVEAPTDDKTYRELITFKNWQKK